MFQQTFPYHKDYQWNFGQDGNLCASEHNQHLVVLLSELSDYKWLFLVNS